MTKLIIFDMEGVIFKPRNFWIELHKVFNTWEQGQELTKKYLHTDYQRLVHEVVVKLWKNKDAKPYYQLVKDTEYMPGVQEVFSHIKKQDWMTVLLSSGSIDLARRAQHDFGFDLIFANELVIKDNTISGDFIWPIGAGTQEKARIIKHLSEDLKIPVKDMTYIGDSDTDIDAFKIVGKSIAFNCKDEVLKKIATHVVEDHDLRKILPHL